MNLTSKQRAYLGSEASTETLFDIDHREVAQHHTFCRCESDW